MNYIYIIQDLQYISLLYESSGPIPIIIKNKVL